MDKIGFLIKTFREKRKLSRRQAAEGICSEKYLYLLETGSRNPSTNILRLFSLRLGVDLFEYLEYLDCADPILVHHVIRQFEAMRAAIDYKAGKQLIDKIKDLSDFQRIPWKYEVEVMVGAHMVYVEKRYEDAVDYLQSIVASIDPCWQDQDYMVHFNILLGSCYMQFRDYASALTTVQDVENIMAKRGAFQRSNTTPLGVGLHRMTYCNLTGDYDRVIETGLSLVQSNAGAHCLGFAGYFYCYLATAYYSKGMQEEALFWFQRCLGSLVVYKCETTAQHVSSLDCFPKIAASPRLCVNMVEKFKDMYKSAIDWEAATNWG